MTTLITQSVQSRLVVVARYRLPTTGVLLSVGFRTVPESQLLHLSCNSIVLTPVLLQPSTRISGLNWTMTNYKDREKWVVVRDITGGWEGKEFIMGSEGSQALPVCPSEWTPFQTHCYEENPAAPGIEHGTSGSAARNTRLY
jgi:hypothetical protein